METAFAPLPALAGGMMIGLAAVLLMATLGRILGATGILAGAILPEGPGDRGWRIAMILGMAAAPVLWWALRGDWPAMTIPVSRPLLVVGGVLVGLGVTIGAGCPSGHGVCGLARLSPRSMVAVPVFMAAAALTVFVLRHVVGV